MDPDTEVNNILTKGSGEDYGKEKWKRPPSSYGSMRSESEEMEEEEEAEAGVGVGVGVGAVAESRGEEVAAVLPEPPPQVETRVQMIRSDSPETLYTMTTQQTKPPGAMVIETSSLDLADFPEDDDDDEEEDEDDMCITNSPEPPEPIEMEGLTEADENSQPGRLHPEQDLPHIFKSIQNILTDFTRDELLNFRMMFCHWESRITLKQALEGDLLDFVDRIIEILGQERALKQTTDTLKRMEKNEEAEKLQQQCRRALLGFLIKPFLIRKHQVIYEGIAQHGKQIFLNTIYVEPQISTRGYGGIDPCHELRPQPPTPVQVPSPDTFIALNNLFRQQKDDGTPVRTVVTTGLPGVGMSVCAAKFSLDWAQERANRDVQLLIKISFKSLWQLRNNDKHNPTKKISFFKAIEYYYPDLTNKFHIMEEPDFKLLLVMDSFDWYRSTLDWENAPEISDGNQAEHLDVLVVNLIRGTLLPRARIWILGRRSAISQIPSKFIDVFTELQGYSDEMKDEYLTKRFSNSELASNIVRHYKRVPMLHILARHPYTCWMVGKLFSYAYSCEGYGRDPPKLTPFLLNILIVLLSRRQQFYNYVRDYEVKWGKEEKQLVIGLGKMALKMLERNTSVFYHEDIKELGLPLTDAVVCSGLCTEVSTTASKSQRTFSFIHYTFQEFMAALYVFLMFHTESKNILESGVPSFPKFLTSMYHNISAAGLVQCALAQTLTSPLGHYDMFLRYLCGLLLPANHYNVLGGYLYPHKHPKVEGLDDVQRLLEQAIQTAPEDRVRNLKECLREMTQEDD